MGNKLPSLKNKINKFDQRGIVYKIPCLDCTVVYIGETGRSFKTRGKEYQGSSVSRISKFALKE